MDDGHVSCLGATTEQCTHERILPRSRGGDAYRKTQDRPSDSPSSGLLKGDEQDPPISISTSSIIKPTPGEVGLLQSYSTPKRKENISSPTHVGPRKSAVHRCRLSGRIDVNSGSLLTKHRSSHTVQISGIGGRSLAGIAATQSTNTLSNSVEPPPKRAKLIRQQPSNLDSLDLMLMASADERIQYCRLSSWAGHGLKDLLDRENDRVNPHRQPLLRPSRLDLHRIVKPSLSMIHLPKKILRLLNIQSMKHIQSILHIKNVSN